MIHVPPALKHRGFLLLWLGIMISMVGSQMQQWALFWHISQLSKDPIAVSVVGGVRFLGLLTFAGVIQLWHIYALTAIQAVAMAFDLPARQSLVPNLVSRDDLPSAFSLQSIVFNTGAIVGPAMSGVVIGYLGQAYVYLINALTFLAVILALILLGPVPQPNSVIQRGLRAAFTDIQDGVRFIRNQPLIQSTMILDFIATFFSSANTLLPYFAQNIIHVGEVAYGWLASAQSIGAVLVGLIASQYHHIRRQGALLLGSVVVFGGATIVFGLSRILTTIFLALALMGAADSVSTIIRNTIRQLNTPDSLRGRMTSINQIFFMGGPQLGEIEAGAVAQFFGVPFAILTGGIGTILGVWLIVSIWPVLRVYDGDEPTPQPVPAD